LIDEKDNFVLIDWDECAYDPPKSRATGADKEATVRHLENLRSDRFLYTEVQLALLYH
jgi:hypothetical protein